MLYVGQCAIHDTPEEATEQQIGIHVFGRAPGYNYSEDSIVRTNARLLRQKLAEFYASEGADEQMIVEIPKGHYLPIFRTAESKVSPSNAHGVVPIHDAEPAPAMSVSTTWVSRAGMWRVTTAGLIALALLSFLTLEPWRRRTPHVAKADSAMQSLWRPFLSDAPPLVIYSNALFEGTSKTGLRYAQPSTDKIRSGSYIDTYTGVGEVAAVYQLTRLFDANHAQFILKRSLLVTWDEARLKNLIFIGSTAENPSLKVVLPDTRDFTILFGDTSSGILNRHPKPGELPLYSRPEQPLTKDYAILALLPGMQPNKWILICSGLTTFGTQAAVEYAIHPDTVEQLFRAAAFPHGTLRPFEAVLETTITGGVPLQTKLVTIHTH
ncbi:MAG: hypothetical protein ACP5E5_04470 [Acidobacteriaceae bacterium]